jgi:hypothetical protein
MRNVLWAMTWGFWQRGRSELLVALGLALVLPTGVYLWLSRQFRLVRLQPEPLGALHFAFLLILLFIATGPVVLALGSPAPMFTRPMRTWQFVVWQFLLGSATVMSIYVLAALLVNFVCDAHWGLLGPALFCATAFVSVQASLWATGGGRPKQIPVLSIVVTIPVCGVLLFWLLAQFQQPSGGEFRNWDTLTGRELATMLAVSAAAILVAILGVARDRRGDQVDWPGLWNRLGFRGRTQIAPCRALGTPAAAQFWFEWRQKGRAMPICAAIFGLCLLSGLTAKVLATEPGVARASVIPSQLEMLAIFGLVFPVLFSAAFGMFIGHCNLSGPTLEMGSFLATRPLSSAGMATAVLKTAALSLAATWGVCLLVFVCGLGELQWLTGGDLFDQLGKLFPRAIPIVKSCWGPFFLLGGGLVSWIAMGLVSSLILTGRERLLTGLLGAVALAFLAGFPLLKSLLPRQFVLPLLNAAAVAGGGLFLAGSWAAFLGASRNGYVGSRTIRLAIASWLICSVLAICALHSILGLSAASVSLSLGLLSLVFAPFAVAPWAVAWNRHR